MDLIEAVVLIGHGGVPKDMPREYIRELSRLEAQRREKKIEQISQRETELDHIIRTWPRTSENDPYRMGIEKLAQALRPRLHPKKLITAYNEFCAPAIEDAVAILAQEGFKRIVLITTMFTPGGNHSEIEIPQLVQTIQAQHPHLEICYAWPYDLHLAAGFLAAQLEQFSK